MVTIFFSDFFSEKQIEADKFNENKRGYSVAFLIGKSEINNDSLWVTLPSLCSNNGVQYMYREAADSFLVMYNDARDVGVNLNVISAYRSFYVQKMLWENSWNNNYRSFHDEIKLSSHILKYLSMPGTSRHHWGTEVDLCSINLAWWKTAYGEKTYSWLKANAWRYGFYQPYGPLGENRKTGYQEEKWHWSFTPIATVILEQYIDSVKYEHLAGFKGSNTAPSLQVIENYVLSVDSFQQPAP